MRAGIYSVFPDGDVLDDGLPGGAVIGLAEIEPSFFWFRTRSRLIADMFARSFPEARSFLDVGCGTGYVLSAIAGKRPGLRLAGVEASPGPLLHARDRLPGAEFILADANNIPYSEEFDCAGAFDVIEHVDDDRAVMRELFSCLRPGGGVILTVPQHPFLWSGFDELSHHRRRYTRGGLKRLVEGAGFRIVRMTSFVTALFPFLVLSRFFGHGRKSGRGDGALREFALPAFINRIFENISEVERAVIIGGVSFPFGGSLLCVAYKDKRDG